MFKKCLKVVMLIGFIATAYHLDLGADCDGKQCQTITAQR